MVCTDYMKKIFLKENWYAIVDDEDFEEISKYKWHLNYARSDYYRAARKDKNNKSIYMHREIMKVKE